MPLITYPKMNAPDFQVCYLRADNDSVTQYCNLFNLSGRTQYNPANKVFSSSGGKVYQYYNTSTNTWITEYGYHNIVHLINAGYSLALVSWSDNDIWYIDTIGQ